jgi:Rrf2 family protein
LTLAHIRNNDCYVKRNSRFSVALHALIQMAERRGAPATSEQLAACLLTNPVVVRRTMAGLRAAGLVGSTPGHGGGWILRRDPEATTLREVYQALDESMLAGASQVESPGCLVEQAISGLMHQVREEAEALLVRRLGEKTLAHLATAVRRLMNKYKIRRLPHAA